MFNKLRSFFTKKEENSYEACLHIPEASSIICKEKYRLRKLTKEEIREIANKAVKEVTDMKIVSGTYIKKERRMTSNVMISPEEGRKLFKEAFLKVLKESPERKNFR